MTIYKPHFACFECRKTFKRRLLGDIRKAGENSVAAKCPQCGNLTADMGLDFESPRKDDRKAWEHLKNLFTAGVTFHSCGCFGPGYIPKTGEKLLELLTEKRLNFISNLGFWLNRKEAATKAEIAKEREETDAYRGQIPLKLQTKKGYVSPQAAIVYWNEKLADLEEKIQTLSKQAKL